MNIQKPKIQLKNGNLHSYFSAKKDSKIKLKTAIFKYFTPINKINKEKA